jgi:1,4-dihydroxy-2-naphthoyl-CoA hydrolase
VRPELLNPFGTLHGGVVSALVDHVLGAVLYPVIKRGHWAATTEFKLNLLAAVRAGTVRARSTIVSLTRRTAVVQVEVDNDGRPCALAQGTVLIVEPRQVLTRAPPPRAAVGAGSGEEPVDHRHGPRRC